jgi:hypothetical protein
VEPPNWYLGHPDSRFHYVRISRTSGTFYCVVVSENSLRFPRTAGFGVRVSSKFWIGPQDAQGHTIDYEHELKLG